jgi:hypothetical protein
MRQQTLAKNRAFSSCFRLTAFGTLFGTLPNPPKVALSTVLAIKHVPDHFAPLFIHFVQRFALLGAHGSLVRSLFRFRRTALRTTIRKSRLVGSQFELFSAYNTRFDWKTHPQYFIETWISPCEIRIALLSAPWMNLSRFTAFRSSFVGKRLPPSGSFLKKIHSPSKPEAATRTAEAL